MPRTGMEAMGAVFILFPMAALHLAAGAVFFIIELRRKRRRFPVYFVVATCLMAVMAALYGQLKPTYRPLYKVLAAEGRQAGQCAAAFKDHSLLTARRMMRGLQDKDLADLCLALEYPVKPDELKRALVKKPDLSAACALVRGREAVPLLVALAEAHEPWLRDNHADREGRLGDIRAAVELLLKNGADPNARDITGNTPLHWALLYQDPQLVSLLIENGACVYLENSEGQSAMRSRTSSAIRDIIIEAAQDPRMTRNCPEIFKKASGRKEKKTPGGGARPAPDQELFYGVQSGMIDTVASSLTQGADPNGRDRKGRSPLHLATTCKKEMPAIVEILVTAGADINARDKRGATPLIVAAGNHCPDTLILLLGKGADPSLANRDGSTAVHYMARWEADRLASAIDELLSAGADIDARDRLGRTPLMMTAYSGNTGDDAMTVMLARGADPDATDRFGNTLLHLLASDSGKTDRVKGVLRLIEAGANLELANNGRMTPLMLAVKSKKTEIVKALLSAGASPDTVDDRGTPLLHTVISCQPEKLAMLAMLIEAGADVDIRNQSGGTAMHRALYGHLHVKCLDPAQRLLRAGAHLNVHDRNGTAPLFGLIHWEIKDPGEALTLLKKFGADIDIRDQQGMTTLLLAAQLGPNPKVMKALLDAGADPSLVDNRGNTLLHCVAMNTKPGGRERLQTALSVTRTMDTRNTSGLSALDLARKYRNASVAEGLMAMEAKQTTAE